MCAFVHGFEPYFYVEAPPAFGPDDCDSLRAQLNVSTLITSSCTIAQMLLSPSRASWLDTQSPCTSEAPHILVHAVHAGSSGRAQQGERHKVVCSCAHRAQADSNALPVSQEEGLSQNCACYTYHGDTGQRSACVTAHHASFKCLIHPSYHSLISQLLLEEHAKP